MTSDRATRGRMTLVIVTLSRMTFTRIPIGRIAISRMTLSKISFQNDTQWASIMTIMTRCKMTISIAECHELFAFLLGAWLF